MNKKIKLIELLNKIANGEDLPKRIKIQDYVFELSKDYEHYYYNEDVEITHLINHNFSNLNDEVEILEDNTEEIEELKHKPVRTNMQEKDAIEDNINICDVCESCRYLENGDMYCDIYNKIVYGEFVFVSNKNINCNKWKKTKESR